MLFPALLMASAAAAAPAPVQSAPLPVAQGSYGYSGTGYAANGCQGNLCNADVLRPVFAALPLAKQRARPLHILQVGDSHTAGDMITHGWRVPLQARFGLGGRGALPPGRPYGGYLTFGVTASQSPGWSVNGVFGKVWQEYGPANGLSGFTLTGYTAGLTLGVSADTPEYNFNSLIVCGLTGPDKGTIQVDLGYQSQAITFGAVDNGARCATVESDWPVASAMLTTLDERPVSITSMGSFRNEGGVVVSNMGVSGSQLRHFARNSDTVLQAELAALDPDMIIFAFGTNEGFNSKMDLEEYASLVRQQIGRVRRLSPRSVPIMLIGAPDAATRSSSLANNGSYAPPVDCGNGWMIPGLLYEVREKQRALANELGLAFWDWNQAMGGACAVQRWRADGLMRGDHVHFTKEGGAAIGNLIIADLTGAMARSMASAR